MIHKLLGSWKPFELPGWLEKISGYVDARKSNLEKQASKFISSIGHAPVVLYGVPFCCLSLRTRSPACQSWTHSRDPHLFGDLLPLMLSAPQLANKNVTRT